MANWQQLGYARVNWSKSALTLWEKNGFRLRIWPYYNIKGVQKSFCKP